MTKPLDRRSEILERIADHILEHGLIASSLRPLAKAAQTSDRMLLYYFRDKAEIMAGALEVVAARMVTLMNAHAAPAPLPYDMLMPQLLAALGDDAFWPYMCVWLEIASRAARGDPFYLGVGEAIGRGFVAWGAAQISVVDEADREALAARLLVTVEGMVLLKSIGLGDVAALGVEGPKAPAPYPPQPQTSRDNQG